MPIVDKLLDYRETGKDLERAVDRPAYILSGEEVFLVQQVRDRIISSLITPGAESMDLVKITGDGKASSVDISRLISEIETPPLFSAHKVISLNQSGFFSRQAGSGHTDQLDQLLDSIPENCHLVFTEESIHSSLSLVRRMRRKGALSARFDFQAPAVLQKWISVLCRREGCRITRDAADSLITRCKGSMSDILSELTTVFLYFRHVGKQDITFPDIDYLCREDLTSKIFDLTDAIAAGRIDQALEKLDILLARREAPLFIQTMLARQTRDLLIAAECATSDRILDSGITQSQYFARKLVRQAKRFTSENLEAMLEDCFQADYAVKTGRLGAEEALSILVIRACGTRS